MRYLKLSAIIHPFLSFNLFHPYISSTLKNYQKYEMVDWKANSFLMILGQCLQLQENVWKEIKPLEETIRDVINVGQIPIEGVQRVTNMLQDSHK